MYKLIFFDYKCYMGDRHLEQPLKAIEILSIQTRETRMIDLKKLRNIQQKDTNYCSSQTVLTKFLQIIVEVQTPDSHITIHTCEHLK